ncbi:MAG: type VI secretion system ATPase TssH, partial [Bacteroidota bacterium]
IDEVVLFKPLLKPELRRIVDIQLEKVDKMLHDKDIHITVDDEAKDWLSTIGYDVTYGARPLKRTIQNYLINPLSTQLLMGTFQAGDTIGVTLGDRGKLEFHKQEPVKEV